MESFREKLKKSYQKSQPPLIQFAIPESSGIRPDQSSKGSESSGKGGMMGISISGSSFGKSSLFFWNSADSIYLRKDMLSIRISFS